MLGGDRTSSELVLYWYPSINFSEPYSVVPFGTSQCKTIGLTFTSKIRVDLRISGQFYVGQGMDAEMISCEYLDGRQKVRGFIVDQKCKILYYDCFLQESLPYPYLT